MTTGWAGAGPPSVPAPGGEQTLFGKPARYPGGLHELAHATWGWLQPNGEWGESNAGLVVGDGEALLVDTLWDPRLTGRMLSAIGQVTDAPIRTIVNTHSDGDHVWGNQLVADASIVSSEAAARVIEEESPKALERFRGIGRGLRTLGSLPLPVVGTLDLPGAPRLPARGVGEYFENMVAPYDFSAVKITRPTRRFSGELELEVGGRAVKLVEVGPAHTAGDVVVLVPDARVVYAADVLFVGVTPVMWAGPLRNWVAALELILGADAEAIVPGHGPVCGKPEVEALLRYWSWLEAAARRRLGGGMSIARAAADILGSDEFRGAEWADWDGPERILINLAALDRERRGQSAQLSILARLRLFAQTAALAAKTNAPT